MVTNQLEDFEDLEERLGGAEEKARTFKALKGDEIDAREADHGIKQKLGEYIQEDAPVISAGLRPISSVEDLDTESPQLITMRPRSGSQNVTTFSRDPVAEDSLDFISEENQNFVLYIDNFLGNMLNYRTDWRADYGDRNLDLYMEEAAEAARNISEQSGHLQAIIVNQSLKPNKGRPVETEVQSRKNNYGAQAEDKIREEVYEEFVDNLKLEGDGTRSSERVIDERRATFYVERT